MKIIKSAITYKAEIPANKEILIDCLEEKAFVECGESQISSTGFVPVFKDGELVETFPGGFAFRVRIDEKIIPKDAIDAAVQKRIKQILDTEGRKVGKKETKEIKADAKWELAKRALVKIKASVTCFYEIETGYLIIATTSANIAGICTGLLVQAVGSVKTETIHVSDVKHGLTTRFKQWLIDYEGFGEFEPCEEVVLTSDYRKVTAKMLSLQQAHSGLTEALTSGFNVKSMGFQFGSIGFRLTDSFQLKRIHFVKEEILDDEENLWAAEAAIAVKAISEVISELVVLLSFKEEGQESIEDKK